MLKFIIPIKIIQQSQYIFILKVYNFPYTTRILCKKYLFIDFTQLKTNTFLLFFFLKISYDFIIFVFIVLLSLVFKIIYFQVPADALAGLLADPEALKAVLLRHVVPSKIPSSGIPYGVTPVGTAGGEEITVKR